MTASQPRRQDAASSIVTVTVTVTALCPRRARCEDVVQEGQHAEQRRRAADERRGGAVLKPLHTIIALETGTPAQRAQPQPHPGTHPWARPGRTRPGTQIPPSLSLSLYC